VGGTAKRRNNSIKPGDVVHTSWTTAPGSKVSILVQRLETFGPDIKASGIFSNGHAKSAAQVLQQTTGQKAWTWGSRVTKVVKPTRRKNPSSRTYKGHKIKGKTGKYTVEPYGFPFTTLKEAKGWLDKHVRDAYPKPNPTVPDVWGIQAKYGSKVVPPGKYKTLPLPPRVGTDLYYEAPTAQGGVANLTVKKKGAGSYYLTIGGGRFQGLRNTKEAREDIQHFLESGRLPARRNPKQATKRRKNPRNRKLDIELPNTNLSVVGVGKDRNGNSVIRFKILDNKAFSIQTVGNRALHQVQRKLMDGGDRHSTWDTMIQREFMQAVIGYIKSHGSPSQKKSLRTYGPSHH
jgi:hypothetical protein